MSDLIWYAIVLLETYAVVILVRNQIVFNFRRKLLRATNEIERDDVAMKLLNEMMDVSYHDMVWQFWRPVKSFYSKETLKLLLDETNTL